MTAPYRRLPRGGHGPRAGEWTAGVAPVLAFALPGVLRLIGGWLALSPIPLGIFPVVAVIAYLARAGLRFLRRRAEQSVPLRRVQPLELIPESSPPGRPTGTEGGPSVPSVEHGADSAIRVHPSADPPRPLTVWRPEGTLRSKEAWVPVTTAVPPPAREPFARNLMILFAGLVLALVLVRQSFFYGYDLIVRSLGQAIYWPLAWPGVIPSPTPTTLAPDYIFLMYLSLLVAFLFASGVPYSSRYPSAQRRLIVALFLLYIPAEVLVDVAYFTINEPFSASGFFLIRGFIGGAFFTAILFSTIVVPPPLRLRTATRRSPRAIVTFASTGILSVAIGAALLFLLYDIVGLGRFFIPFAILLLLPLISLVVFGVIGRVLYDRELKRRPKLPLAVYTPSVSIIIPAFNEEANIAEAIRSVDAGAAHYPGLCELIVGNDGSTDRTAAIARREIAALKFLKGSVVDLPHGGKSNALNGALRVATGDIIVRIDADCRLSTETGFGPLVGHFADPWVGGVQGRILPLQQTGWTRHMRLMEIAWNHLFLRRGMMAVRAAQVVDGAFCAFRRKDIVAIGGWVPWNGEDTEVTLRLQRAGYRMRFEPDATVFEDVPENLAKLRRQRIRWNRGGLFAHYRHFPALLSDRPEYGGLALLLWFILFIRAGLRSLIYLYAILVVIYLPTILHVALIAALLLIPRGAVVAYYMVRLGKAREIPWMVIWPGTAVVKAHFSVESFGTMLPGAYPEFSE